MSDQPRIFRVRTLVSPVRPYDWPFARERAADIATHWKKLVTARPALFDGRVLMGRDIAVSDENGGVFSASHFETSFSSFIAWRDFGFPDKSVFNTFAMGALRSADGAFLLGEMGAHTANAGKVYFPAGTPDPDDVVGASVDLAGSVAREMREETGIDIDECEIDPVWRIVIAGQRVACMRPLALPGRADAICARVAAQIAREKEPELARLHPVRRMSDLEGCQTLDFIEAYLASEFATR
ncbi:MAG: NUDIX hydrolase [Hyphomicrobiales bacterium]|nr:NUDIX hydrolase [Hyphomicrobiales bacterium]